jgi:hypothetical protein
MFQNQPGTMDSYQHQVDASHSKHFQEWGQNLTGLRVHDVASHTETML